VTKEMCWSAERTTTCHCCLATDLTGTVRHRPSRRQEVGPIHQHPHLGSSLFAEQEFFGITLFAVRAVDSRPRLLNGQVLVLSTADLAKSFPAVARSYTEEQGGY
jgi:hypothetical protein